jgi:nitroreductase
METSHFLEIMNSRFACKKYKDIPLSKESIEAILEAGRLSPTSFGLEGWAFHVVQNIDLRNRLTVACFDQESVLTAPLTIVITSLTESSYEPQGDFVRQRGERFPGTLDEFVSDYEGYFSFLKDMGRLNAWSKSQCYIAAANMMNIAVVEGIQSCAIEGFDEHKVATILNIDENKWNIALVITFGYRDEEVREKIREPLEKLVTYYH